MQRTGDGGGAASMRVREATSPRSTPNLTPSSFHGELNCDDVPDHANGSAGGANPQGSLVTSLTPSPVVRSSSSAKEATAAASIYQTRKRMKGRPQNALFMLACTMGGGASTGTNNSQVVDLRALDPSPCPSRESHSPPQSGSRHHLGLRSEDVPATQILDFLYLGSVKDAQDAAFLAKHQIRYILNVSQEEYWSVDKKVQIFTFNVDDSATADIAALFQPTRELINSIRARYYRYAGSESSTRPAVLVHCQKGRSRSVTIVLAYLIYTNGWSVAEAMKYVGTRRPCAEPNIGFMEELRKLQESLSPEERTRRYSELCWFMRNLSAETAQSHVRELFEKRIGIVRHVVTYVVAGSEAGNVGDVGTTEKADGRGLVTTEHNARLSASLPATPPPSDIGTAEPLVPPDLEVTPGKQASGFNEQRAATHTDSPAYKDARGSVSPLRRPGTEKTMLCFVFFTCREDVLNGIKSGQFKQLLRQLHPATGKQIKYATGPKLKKMMVEHQSISGSFVQDVARFRGHATTSPDGESEAIGVDGAPQAEGAVPTTSKAAEETLSV